MASRLSARLSTRNAYESLWYHAPPNLLAPTVTSTTLAFSTASTFAANTQNGERPFKRDTFALRQAKARKDANLSRQMVLREQRAKDFGDPIRGVPTAFVESFDAVAPQQVAQDSDAVSLEALKADPDKPPPSSPHALGEIHLDHAIRPKELEKSIKFSQWLTEPLAPTDLGRFDPDLEAKERRQWEARHTTAAEAIQRIISLANGSSQHQTKKNVERVVDTLGRHRTDQMLKPKASAITTQNAALAQNIEPMPRVGPDTGSSEVQIGILTAKIRVLADRYEIDGHKDKINKRNLRLLLHRRQKLLKYMERKERGSERWQYMLETLGLTPACWKGQIAVE